MSFAGIIASGQYAELTEAQGLKIDLKYATADNFVGRNVYGDFNRAFLHKVAFEKFQKARELLRQKQPRYQFIIFDALRPRSVQWLLWNVVKGTPQQIYIADPERGSMHNYGMAIDLSILDEQGQEIDMGTPFDHFSPLAQPQLEDQFRQSGELAEKQLQNRLLLRGVMEGAGFLQLPTEWWHYNAAPVEEVRSHFQILEN